MTRHIHADVIHAWAEGEVVEFRKHSSEPWLDVDDPCFHSRYEYRIKPKTVRREGWVNIYRMPDKDRTECGCVVHKTKQEALSCVGMHAIATVRIEWEEEE